MSRAHLEAPVLAGALQLLPLRGFPALRINSGMVRTRDGRMVKLAPEGTSDILSVVPRSGRFFAVEVKAPGKRGKTTEAQREFLAAVRAAGGVAVAIDDLAELDRILARLAQDPYAIIEQEEP